MPAPSSAELRVLFAGDAMLGRGIDQALPHPGDPSLYETWRGLDDARFFLERAARTNGPLPEVRGFDYIWGETLAVMDALSPDLRLVNLECAIAAGGAPAPEKRMHFRMNPANVETLTRARIDLCALANNHILDWGEAGLRETIATLDGAGIRHAGAGRHRDAACAPAILDIPGKGRVVLVSLATRSSGVRRAWAAGLARPGVNWIALERLWLDDLRRQLDGVKRAGDLLIVSIHWGDNYDFTIHPQQRRFAQALIDELGVDLIHGHSSHHAKGIELYKGKAILYGCGDFINDYETLEPRVDPRVFPHDLGALYLARFALPEGNLLGLELRPIRMRRLSATMAGAEDAARLAAILNREGAALGTTIALADGLLQVLPRNS
ncbi:MAG: CapA family protein [Kiloniellales bacterium]